MRRQLPPIHCFSGFDLFCLLEHHAQVTPDKAFLIWDPFDVEISLTARTWSFERFARSTLEIATGLSARGVGRGDKIIIHMENCIEMLLALFACVRIGAIAVVTNSRSSEDEFDYFVQHSQAIGIISQPKFSKLISRSGKDLPWVIFADVNIHDETSKPTKSDVSFSSLFDKSGSLPPRIIDSNAPCAVFYTSGTTARPKGVVLSHANLLWGARINAIQQAMVPEDVTMTFLPLFHINAQAYSILPSLWVGCTIVLQPRFSLSRFWDVAVRYQATWVSIVTFCVKLLKEKEVPKHNFRLWGEAMCEPPSDAYFGVKTLGWFGMTETVAHPIVGYINQPNRSMSMGRPAPEYDIAITREDGSQVETNEVGQLCVGGIPGLSLFVEYLYDEKATEDSFDENGRFLTGDLVESYDDGFILYRGRLKDMMKVRGENVAASEIENAINKMPEILEAAVVGKLDDLHGDLPVAYVVPGPSDDIPEDTLVDLVIKNCRSALADFKVPTEVRIIEELPRIGPLAKVDKLSLRKEVNEN